MKPSKTIIAACRLLKKRVRFEDTYLHLPGSSCDNNDAEVIRQAVDPYVTTWIIPIIEAIEANDVKSLNKYLL